jgi:hypothetical protein
MRRALALLLLLAGCGADGASFVVTDVRIDALLRDDVEALAVFALGPRRSDDILLTCSTLLPRAVEVTDERVDVLARADVVFSDPEGREVTLESVEAGDNRLVYVEADDATGILIANGCTGGVTVESGKTVQVEVVVWPIQP